MLLELTSWMLPSDPAPALTAGPGAHRRRFQYRLDDVDSRRTHKGPCSSEKRSREGLTPMQEESGSQAQRWARPQGSSPQPASGGTASLGPACGRDRGPLSDRSSSCPPPFDSPPLYSFLLTSSRKESKQCQNMAAAATRRYRENSGCFRPPPPTPSYLFATSRTSVRSG